MRPVYENNRNAPRMKKGKYSKNIVSTDAWKRFKAAFPEHNITWKDFYSAWCDIAETVRTEAVENPLGVKLGSYTGELKVQFTPKKIETLDVLTSEEVGEGLGFLNLNTRDKVIKVKWERRWAVRFNRFLQFFAFDPVREIQESASKYADNNSNKIRIARVTVGNNNWKKNK